MGWDSDQKKVIRANSRTTGANVWGTDASNSQVIDAGGHDFHDQDLANAITETLNINGINSMAADLDMGVTFKITNLAAGVAGTDGVNKDQLDVVDGKADQNAADILTNAGNIATNASNINTNALDIAANTGDIATNAGNISTNQSNISANAGQIVAVKGAGWTDENLTDHETRIEALEGSGNSIMDIDWESLTAGQYAGIVGNFTSNGAITAGDMLYFVGADNVGIADNATAGKRDAIGMAVESVGSGLPIKVLLQGFYKASGTLFASPGVHYLWNTGDTTSTRPSGGDWVERVGISLDDGSVIYIDPQQGYSS